MGRLEGKVAIVTGAGRGHAEAVARRFAKEGAAVSICDVIPVQDLEAKVGSEIRAAGGDVICFETDVSQEAPVNEMVAATIEKFGTVDILANVVGIAGPTKDVWDMSLEEWRRTLEVNLDSLFICSKAVLPEMIRKKYGEDYQLQFRDRETAAFAQSTLCDLKDGGHRFHTHARRRCRTLQYQRQRHLSGLAYRKKP